MFPRHTQHKTFDAPSLHTRVFTRLHAWVTERKARRTPEPEQHLREGHPGEYAVLGEVQQPLGRRDLVLDVSTPLCFLLLLLLLLLLPGTDARERKAEKIVDQTTVSRRRMQALNDPQTPRPVQHEILLFYFPSGNCR